MTLDAGFAHKQVLHHKKPKAFDLVGLEAAYKDGTLPAVPPFPKLDEGLSLDDQAGA